MTAREYTQEWTRLERPTNFQDDMDAFEALEYSFYEDHERQPSREEIGEMWSVIDDWFKAE